MGLWLQTKPSAEKRQQCLSCHAPAVKVFPQHTDRIIEQVLAGKVTVEGISCASCHMVEKLVEDPKQVPAFDISADKTMFGPFKDPEELKKVEGIGAATYEHNKASIKVKD